jgi:hypothetical protein
MLRKIGIEGNVVNEDGSLTPLVNRNVNGWKVLKVYWDDQNRIWSQNWTSYINTDFVKIETDHQPIEIVFWNQQDQCRCYHRLYAKWPGYQDTQKI